MEARWAHNPKVPRSKLGSATFFFFGMDLAELISGLDYASRPDARFIKRGTDTINACMKSPSSLYCLTEICFNQKLSVSVRVLAAQLIYKTLKNKKSVNHDVPAHLLDRLVNLCHSSLNHSVILSGLCRVIARLIGSFIKPMSIAHLFTLNQQVGMTVLTELALEVTPNESCTAAWAEEILCAIERVDVVTEKIYHLLILWIPYIRKERLVKSSVLLRPNNSHAYEEFALEVSKHAPCSEMLEILRIYTACNKVLFVDMATNLVCNIPAHEANALLETVTKMTWESIASSDLELLEHITGFWEVAPPTESTAWVVACIAVFPASFESWISDDMERFREIRRDVRDSLRAMAKTSNVVVCGLFRNLVESDWRSLEAGLHAISAVAKYVPKGECAASLLGIGSRLNLSTSHRSVLCSYLLLMHVYEDIRTSLNASLAIACLTLPHFDRVYPFAAKQDHAAVVVLTRCNLDVQHYNQLMSIVCLAKIRKNLTRQSLLILLETLAEKAHDFTCSSSLLKFAKDGIDAFELNAILLKSPHAFELITCGIVNLEKVVASGPADAVPVLLLTCMQKAPVELWAPLVELSIQHYAPVWTVIAKDVFAVTHSTNFVYSMSSHLLRNINACTPHQLQAWLAFLSTHPVDWVGRQDECRKWIAINESMQSIGGSVSHKKS